MDSSGFKQTDREKYILFSNVKTSILGILKCILEKLKAGANLAKKNKKSKPYEGIKKLMKGLGRLNKENNNIFLNKPKLMIKNYNKFNKIIKKDKYKFNKEHYFNNYQLSKCLTDTQVTIESYSLE